MNTIPAADDRRLHPNRFNRWLASGQGRCALLFLAACFSLPATFAISPDVGLDGSWHLSLQLAELQHKVFGRDFVFTYGPLGYLMIHAATNKTVLFLYDLFILGSLLAIYRVLLPQRPRLWDALVLIALAVVTKTSLGSAALFTILCYWLWRVYEGGQWPAVFGSLAAASALFFGKVNYGMIMVLLVPGYAVGLLLLQSRRRAQGLALLFGFPLLVWLGALAWHVDLRMYLRSGAELIAGYNEAMYSCPARTPFSLKLACVFLLAMGMAVLLGRRRLPWPGQAMILPLIGLATLLLFKNGFVRPDDDHTKTFFEPLPLLLAVWCIGWRGFGAVRILLIASLVYPLVRLTADTKSFGRTELVESLPLRYFKQVISLPWREDGPYLEERLRARFPEMILPGEIQTTLGGSSVDVMPWDSSIAILNGLNYQPRPVPQSYSVYTPWLDEVNARFLESTNAPDWLLYSCAQIGTIDDRPAAWDESLTKRRLLENYDFDSAFKLPMRVWPDQKLEPGTVYLLKHAARSRQLVPLTTNQVTLTLGQTLPVPATTNLVFLTLEVNRSIPGKLKAALLSPSELTVTFNYADASSRNYRAILPILKTGVLVNRRVESAEEVGNWLQREGTGDMAVRSVCFNTSSPWAFGSPLKGELVEYKFADKAHP